MKFGPTNRHTYKLRESTEKRIFLKIKPRSPWILYWMFLAHSIYTHCIVGRYKCNLKHACIVRKKTNNLKCLNLFAPCMPCPCILFGTDKRIPRDYNKIPIFNLTIIDRYQHRKFLQKKKNIAWLQVTICDTEVTRLHERIDVFQYFFGLMHTINYSL